MRVGQFKYFQSGAKGFLTGVLLIASAMFLNGQSKTSTIEKQIILLENSTEGPLWVKTTLIESGVLKTPKYNFTNEFDTEKSEDNIKGIFYEGLPFKGKPTKVFSWYGVPENLTKDDKV
ncbi:hypothetical protein, partial [Zobellia laminariae]|uniref:hypothetical protein n=1 Tax=Zobellia laminariae TaxID=248906 RepID=UPI004056627E